MKLISKLLRNHNKVFYSCVIDDHPKFYWQGYIFVNALQKIAKVRGNRIFIHLIKQNIAFENFLKAGGVNIKYIKPWGDKKYCNKLQQLETKELQKADYVFFCDADIAIVEDLSNLAKKHRNKIIGKIVDAPNPELERLKAIYDLFDIQYPNISTDTLTSGQTFELNFNGGLYGIPSKFIAELGGNWKKLASKMLNSDNVKNILVDKINHIDQVSFSMALQDLDLPYQLLGYNYNCPTHIKNTKLLDSKLGSEVKVIHYHSNISDTGLLNSVENKFAKKAVEKINRVLKKDFNNPLFWNYRYATNPALGSGRESRGDTAKYKLRLLKNIGVEKDDAILDVGCGDLEIVKHLSLKNYTGIDISTEAVTKGKIKFPNFNFYNFDIEKHKVEKTDTVICLDVLIHQPDLKKYTQLIDFITAKAINRVVVSGYEKQSDTSHMCFFHENIKKSFEKTGRFKNVYKIGEYRDLSVYIADKGRFIEKQTKNDLTNHVICDSLNIKTIDNNLLLETITFSRANFGWYTKHYPRLYEYPWILKKLQKNPANLKIADFGAGITPLPLQLSQRGAKVFTIDNHNIKRDLQIIDKVNEWGFFDYAVLDDNITSYNQSLCDQTFEKNSLDVWYSVSVIEHMPAQTRRTIFKIMADTLKNRGRLLLTLDLVKGTQDLWNMSAGKIVEDKKEHGTLDSFVYELKSFGFKINEKKRYKMPENEKVDLAMISGVITK
jgi:2-polyprenyl-3-methyl-5-hydroxy-6-metoxy-1,4-benzoquinol methylase